jgi:hypothetical protein
MLAGSNCNCLICQLEANLVAEFAADRNAASYSKLAARRLVLSRFPTAIQLIQRLHNPKAEYQPPTSDQILRELLPPPADSALHQFWQSMLLLAFIPTIHRTTSQISNTFSCLTRDDVSQQLLGLLLEFICSSELQSRQSHLAFTIARKIRRLAFRWAIRESRIEFPEEANGHPIISPPQEPFDHSQPALLLLEFLDSCERRGWLSTTERRLLMQFKIEGISCQELSRRNGHSPIALQHRIQRLIDRLRRLSRTPAAGIAQQLELFRK